MDPADIQAELARRHGITVPPSDPSYIQATMCELMLADERKRLDAAADRIEKGVRWMAGGPTVNWRIILVASGVIVAAILIGAGGGYWFRGAAPILVGVRAGAEHCEDRNDGSRVCLIPVYERLPALVGNKQY